MKKINIITAAWPPQHFVATNPMAAFESMHFRDALNYAHIYFQQNELPEGMQQVNRISIKWLQVFFDQGQATITMPERQKGLLASIRRLLIWDQQAHQGDQKKKTWVKNLPETSEAIIEQCLAYLNISPEEKRTYLTLLLTTLPGWSAYIQYRTDTDSSITQREYLAFRLILTCLVWPEAHALLEWHQNARKTADTSNTYKELCAREASYHDDLLKKLHASQASFAQTKTVVKAQWICCIDVRSEPLRRALEANGEYETFGFAGFFGAPVSIEHAVTGYRYASCPVLLKPTHCVVEQPASDFHGYQKRYQYTQRIKQWYQSLKYTFTAPFSLVEALGLSAGIWMGIRTFFPALSGRPFRTKMKLRPNVDTIPIEEKISYAANMLTSIGLTKHFSPLVVLCGHGSSTQNNAHATALDCGACGGNKGGANARILAVILNDPVIRMQLNSEYGIAIPNETFFLAAQHNTTTATIDFDDHLAPASHRFEVENLKKETQRMIAKLGGKDAQQRANDWAQVRPEWGLAKNASFIIAPRWLTQSIDLEGRAFLHSYEWEQDTNGSILTGILTAPMIVAQWINAQYFFSTLDPVAFGCGSKVTTNIVGKIGVMQGNGSDLMHGLPLQSLFISDTQTYHRLQRLLVVIYAPKKRVEIIMTQHPLLKTLLGNGWIHLVCLDTANSSVNNTSI